MDSKEKERLRKEYRSMSDEEIMDLFQTDRSEFEEGVFGIVKEEFQRRNLQRKIDEMKKLEELRRRSAKVVSVVVASFPYRHEAELVKNYLVENGIEAIVRADDVGGFRPHLTFTGGSTGMACILVRKEDVAKAKDILRIFEQ